MAKTTYRDNFIPSKELTGAVMQMEKYLFLLNRMGANGEKFLSEKYSDKLAPYNLQIKIVNPKGIIISGISSKFNCGIKFFEHIFHTSIYHSKVIKLEVSLGKMCYFKHKLYL